MSKLDNYVLKRQKDDNCVLGVLYDVDGKELCKTLENPWKDNQKDISCIPVGQYLCVPFSGTKYQDVWQLKDVKDRSYILIHQGNYERDTEGCVLVGEEFDFNGNLRMITKSRLTLNKLRRILPQKFWLNII